MSSAWKQGTLLKFQPKTTIISFKKIYKKGKKEKGCRPASSANQIFSPVSKCRKARRRRRRSDKGSARRDAPKKFSSPFFLDGVPLGRYAQQEAMDGVSAT